MKECPICHEPNGDYRDTCFNCHTSLNFKKYDATNSDMKECPKCGAVNNHSSYSCYNCGANLAEVKNIYNEVTYTCKHCGCSISSEGLCSKCKSSKTALKITLYILACFVAAVITSVLKINGIILGALPTIIMWIILFWLANLIPNSYYSSSKNTTVNNFDPAYSSNNNEPKPISSNGIKINENTVLKEFKVADVTFGERQNNLKKIESCIRSNQKINVTFEKYLYESKTAIKILANGLDIGNIPKDDVHYFLIKDATYEPDKLYISNFTNENTEEIYYARIRVVFKKIVNSNNISYPRTFREVFTSILERLDSINDGKLRCKNVVLKNAISEIQTIEKSGITSEADFDGITAAYTMIYNITFDLLSSGEYHVYRGELNPMNESSHLYSVCLQCLEWAEKHGQITNEEKEEQLEILKENIQHVG